MAICEQCGKDVAPGDKVTERVGVSFLHFCSSAHAAEYIEERKAAARRESAKSEATPAPVPTPKRKPRAKKQTP